MTVSAGRHPVEYHRAVSFRYSLGIGLALTGLRGAATGATQGSLLDGVKDTPARVVAGLTLAASSVVWVGIVPGIGSQVVDWLAYGHRSRPQGREELRQAMCAA